MNDDAYITGMPMERHALTLVTVDPIAPAIEAAWECIPVTCQTLKNNTAFAKEIYAARPTGPSTTYPAQLPEMMNRLVATLRRNVGAAAELRESINTITDALFVAVRDLDEQRANLTGQRGLDYDMAASKITIVIKRLDIQQDKLFAYEQLAQQWQRKLEFFRFDHA